MNPKSALYRGIIALGVSLALLMAPLAPLPLFLWAPLCKLSFPIPHLDRRIQAFLTKGRGILLFLAQMIKFLLILSLLVFLLAKMLPWKAILQGKLVPLPNPPQENATSPSQEDSNQETPPPENFSERTSPDLEHPFLKTIQQAAIVQRYRPLFELADQIAPPPDPSKTGPKKGKNADRVYLKAYLVKLREPIAYFTHLRRFLVEHPSLIVPMGFQLKGYTPQYGFDPEKTVVSTRQLARKIQKMNSQIPKALFNQTIRTLEEGGVLTGKVSCDTVEIHAPVKENNPKQWIKNRWKKENIPKGAPSARLGAKPSYEKDKTTKKQKVRFYWGWKSGALTEKNPTFGVEVCVAERTKPANEADVLFALPLLKDYRELTQLNVRIFIADAAFDAFYVYEDVYGDEEQEEHGQAYIPLNTRGHVPIERKFGPHGGLMAPCGKEMKTESIWTDPNKGYRRRRDKCPYTQNQRKSGKVTCPIHHPRFLSKRGCTRTMNLDDVHNLRCAIDRNSKEFKMIFNERTTTERLFAKADQANFEHPNVRNLRSVTNLNTLGYTLINLEAILRIQAAKQNPGS